MVKKHIAEGFADLSTLLVTYHVTYAHVNRQTKSVAQDNGHFAVVSLNTVNLA